MTSYTVDVELRSDVLSLADMEKVIGIAGAPGSRNRGDQRPFGRGANPHSIWRCNANDDPDYVDENLLDQISRVFTKITPEQIRQSLEKMANADGTLRIGVYFREMCASTELPPWVLAICLRACISIEISSYPCDEDYDV